ncbi:hypothetical protein, partial [Burkholderia multivorans]|uniref:hypothetical protein n=1 Tax=Burkholderia multivorans TaxID=87883 RepID=UPI001B8DFB6F
MYQSASALARERGLGAAGCCGAAAAGAALEVTALGVVTAVAAAVLAAGADGEPVFRYHSASVDAARFAGVAPAAGFAAGAG